VRAVDLDQLHERKVITINSSVHAVPWADILYFGDCWWNEPENQAAVATFLAASSPSRRMLRASVLICARPSRRTVGRARYPDEMDSLTAATNLAAHLVGRGRTIVWLARQQAAADGAVYGIISRTAGSASAALRASARRHRHHGRTAAAHGHYAAQCSPQSAYADLWPVVDLADARRGVQLKPVLIRGM
jgi:hypothetical protein